MKKYLLMGVAALAFASCSNTEDLYDQGAVDNLVVAKYKQAFVKNFGQPAPDQDWGFGSTTRGVTRAASYGSSHTCYESGWQNKLNFELPGDYVTVDANTQLKSNTVYYVPESYTGSINFDNFNGDLYVAGKVTSFSGNPGNLNLYIFDGGSWVSKFTTGTIYIYNNGNLDLPSDALQSSNVQAIYNGGGLKLGANANVANSIKIYSTGTIELSGTSNDYKATSDIHGTMSVNGSIKLQNSTEKYICNLVATGKVDNTDGNKLTISNLEANELTFDGNNFYMTEGGHINVATTITLPNGNCQVHAVSGSNALIECANIVFQNDNDFNRTFSDNIYFQIGGYIDMSGATNTGSIERKKYNTVAEYVAANGNLNNHLNAGSASGSPACGGSWTVGGTTPTPPTPGNDEDNDEDNDDELDGYTFLCRVFAEDLSAEEKGDFDFNDVVFDVYKNSSNEAKIVIRAAGGTLPLKVNGYEVHEACGVSVSTMINTKNPDYNYMVVLPGTVSGISDKADVNANIRVEVDKNGWKILEAVTGEPAAKVAVDEEIDWCTERSDLKEKYPKFVDYVANPSNARWW